MFIMMKKKKSEKDFEKVLIKWWKPPTPYVFSYEVVLNKGKCKRAVLQSGSVDQDLIVAPPQERQFKRFMGFYLSLPTLS